MIMRVRNMIGCLFVAVVCLSTPYVIWDAAVYTQSYDVLNRCMYLDMCRNTRLPDLSDRGIHAYYQTSLNHPEASRIVLDLFRRAYKTAPIFLYVDNTRSHALDLEAYQPIVLIQHAKNVQSSVNHGMYFGTVAAGTAYLNRIKHAAKGADWLILLEDDTWVCNTVFTKQLAFDLNGECSAQYNPGWDYLTPGPCFGGCGGSILRGPFLRRMRVDQPFVRAILAQINRSVASDELLSAMVYHSNGTLGNSAYFSQGMIASPGIVHGFKSFYPGRLDQAQADECLNQ